MKPVYKHLLMFALLLVAGWTVAAATPTKLLTKTDAEGLKYYWSDGSTVHESSLAETATTPAQIYSMLRFVYKDPRVPGPSTAAYDGPSTTYSSTYYTQDASVNNPNGTASYFLNDNATRTAVRDVYYGAIGQGWNLSASDVTAPTNEGYTVMLVAVKDSYQSYATDTYYPSGSHLSDSASVVTFLDRMVDSVMVITNSVRVNEGTREAGAVFNCSSYLNRFFFLSKGQARDISYGQNLYSTWYAKATRSSSYPSTSYFGNQSPFAEMFEQFSPNNGYVDTDATFSDITDIYSQLAAGATYNIRHDCPSALMQHHDFSVAGTGNTEHKPLGGLNLFVPDYRLESWFQTVDWVWQSISSGGTVTNTTTQVDARSMYDDATFCQNGSSYVSGYNPNWTYDSHTGLYITYDYEYIGQTYPVSRSSALYHFYNPHHFPKMNLYTIQLTADTTGVKRVEDGTTYYQVRVSWTSSLSKLVGDGIVEYFHLYTIGADGTYSTLIERNSDEFNTAEYTVEDGAYCYYYEVPQQEYSQYFTYIVSGQPVNDGVIYFTPTWSNEDDVFIPGWNTNESLRLVLVDNISQYTTAGEFNHYNNKLRVQQGANPWLANDLLTGDNILHFVRIDDQGEETEFATLNYYRGGAAIFTSTNQLNMVGSTSKTFTVNTTGVTGTVTLTASSGFSVSPSSFTATGTDRTITVTHSGSTATGTITISANGVDNQVVNLNWSSTQTAYASIDYGSMEGTSLSASTDEKGGTWSYTGTGSYAYGLSGPISNVNYMYFTSDGSATYTFPAGVNLSTANVTITVQSGSYGTGYLYVNGSSIRYNGSTVTNTFSNVNVSNGSVVITSPSGSSGSSDYSLRIRSISISLNDDASGYPTSGAVTIKPSVNYVYANAANNTTLNYTARPFAAGDTTWLASAIDYVNDVFSAYTGDNSHSAYYNYYVTKADTVYDGPTIIRPTAAITMSSAEEMIQVKGAKLTGGVTITTTGNFTVSPSTLTRQEALAGTTVKLTYTGNAAPGTTVTGTMTVTSTGAQPSTVTITYVVPDKPVLTASTNTVTIEAPALNGTFTVSGANLTSDVYMVVSDGIGVTPASISAEDAMNGNYTLTVMPLNPKQSVTGTVTITSEGADDVVVYVNYTAPEQPVVTTPTLSVSPATVAIDGNQGMTGTFTVTGSNLTGNVTITAPAGFGVSPATVTPTDGAVNQTVTITADGTAASGTVTVASSGATSKTVAVTYTAAAAPTPELSVSTNAVAIDGNEGTTGTFTVTGTNLTGDITFASSNSDFSVVNNNGTVTVTYNGNASSDASTTITVSSPGAQSQTVEVTYTAPTGQGGGYNVGDILGSLDLSQITSTTTLTAPWSGSMGYASWTGYNYMSYNSTMTFTVPSDVNFSNQSVTIAMTFPNYNYNATSITINGTSYSITNNATNYFVVDGVSSGDTITIVTDRNSYTYLDHSSSIVVYYGNYSGN